LSTAGSLRISFDAAVGGYGNGILSITNGGTVTVALATLAAVADSKGAVTVAGTNSKWTLDGELDVGTGGTGLLTVNNGGTVTAASVHVYPSGTLTGNSTVTTTSGATTIEGTIEPSSGRLTIAGGGDLTFSGTTALMASNVVPSGADNVYVSNGAASRTGKLKVRITGTFTPDMTYTLLHAYNTLNNTRFQSYSINYPTCQCFTPVILKYTANNVNLYLEPVPCCQ
jgi:T5SS/PEP-CTERM-associated repeat protein